MKHRVDPAPGPAAPLPGLADALRDRTAALHRQAERAGIVHGILTGRVSRAGYALFLRNLLPAYRAMERGLGRHAGRPGLGALHVPALLRAPAIERDLAHLSGPGWRRDLPLLGPGRRYALRVVAAAQGDGAALIAHCYTRYLGDLAGGRLLHRRLQAALGLEAEGLSFYEFPGVPDPAALGRAYRAAIDAAAAGLADRERVIEEAAVAFQLNIDVSMAVEAAVAGDAAAPA